MFNEEKYITRILIHILFGMAIYYVPFFPRIFFFAIIIYFLGKIIVAPPSQKTMQVLKGCAYFVGIEVLFRMTNGAIFYEASKYFVILFVVLGMFYKGVSGRAYPYFIYLVALVPSILVATTSIGYDSNFRTNIAFVLSGPVCLGLAALFCYDKVITKQQVSEVLLSLALPVVSLTAYLFLYTPNLKDVISGTQSNFATSGGFGPNQVATMLGLGMFVFTIRFFLKSPNIFIKTINAILIVAILYRAIITFSRGGVIGAIMMIIAFLVILYFRSGFKQKTTIIVSSVLLVLSLAASWMISSTQTSGMIDKRYANQDAAGREKEDLSTGRVDLFVHEIEGFINNPFFGVGASGMKEIRIRESGRGVVSHNELSRLFSEHGLFGVIIFVILVVKPLIYRSNNRSNVYFYAFLCFWFATINHSAMRIAAPAFVYALSLLNIVHDKRPLHRKSIAR